MTPREVVLCAIDGAIDPKRMSKGEAHEFLEDISAEIRVRIEAIESDMRAAGQDWN